MDFLPPSHGEIEFAVPLPPVSHQASSKSKADFMRVVRDITEGASYLLSGDIQLEVEWMVQEQIRYETDRAPDLDNILKPLFDSIRGPNGIIVDDTQIQRISCSWIDLTQEGEQLFVSLKYLPDEWIPKEGLFFVQFEGAMCMPMHHTSSSSEQLLHLDLFERMIDRRNQLIQRGESYQRARYFMSVQRVFHKTRLKGFEVVTASELRQKLSAAQKLEQE